MSDDPNISRRQLLRGRIGQAAAAAIKAVNASAADAVQASAGHSSASSPPGSAPSVGRRFVLPIHRPPGAVDEVAFLAGCTRCNECIKACPVNAIVHAPSRFREAAGTPMIDPAVAGCVMCPDTPCITACKPAVLRLDRPLKMGVAWIQNLACLAHTGSFCSVCSERCPVENAIEVKAGKPRIREDICTGCGTCASVCPAPTNAIVIMPLADRPRAE